MNKKTKNKLYHLFRTKNKVLIIIIPFLFLLIMGSMAYLVLTNSIENEFVIGEVKTEIKNETTNENIYIQNTGNVSIYIRAYITIELEDENQNVLATTPNENTDYNISINNTSNWLKAEDGYYYYQNIVNPNENTDIFINDFIKLKNNVNLNITVQSIQANPKKAVEEAWNVNIINNEINLKENQ